VREGTIHRHDIIQPLDLLLVGFLDDSHVHKMLCGKKVSMETPLPTDAKSYHHLGNVGSLGVISTPAALDDVFVVGVRARPRHSRTLAIDNLSTR
jgi:hypothetical protein